MKILAVCSFGVGSSMVLKMTIEKALKELGVNAEAENTDLVSASAMSVDYIFTSPEFADEVKERVDCPVVAIKKFMDYQEVLENVKNIVNK